MNVAELRAELERDQYWRRDEIRLLQNQVSFIKGKDDKNIFRRSIVVILYAHLEGFCKFAFKAYIDAVNSTGIKCSEASYAIAAATLEDVFRDLRDPNSKSDLFKNSLPDDTKLHRFAREREFLERASSFENQEVDVSDSVVNTASNLRPVVLRKMLYRVGLPHDLFRNLEGDIHKLVNYRNSISHGSRRTGLGEKEYLDLRVCVFDIMDDITRQLMRVYQEEGYKK